MYRTAFSCSRAISVIAGFIDLSCQRCNLCSYVFRIGSVLDQTDDHVGMTSVNQCCVADHEGSLSVAGDFPCLVADDRRFVRDARRDLVAAVLLLQIIPDLSGGSGEA